MRLALNTVHLPVKRRETNVANAVVSDAANVAKGRFVSLAVVSALHNVQVKSAVRMTDVVGSALHVLGSPTVKSVRSS